MNPFVLFAWVAFTLTVAAGVGIIIMVVVAAHRERWQWDAAAVAAERMIERNRARSPRHAAGMPRTDSGAGRTQTGPIAAQLPAVPVLPRTIPRVSDSGTGRMTLAKGMPRESLGAPAPRTSGSAPAVPPRTPQYVTAADLMPVIVPTPFGQPQPPSAGTETFERVPTDTGELRALTDAYIHRMRADEAAYRETLTS